LTAGFEVVRTEKELQLYLERKYGKEEAEKILREFKEGESGQEPQHDL